jgi:hypothetical protein
MKGSTRLSHNRHRSIPESISGAQAARHFREPSGKKRRFGGLIERVNVNGLRVNQARLTAALGGAEEAHGRKFG